MKSRIIEENRNPIFKRRELLAEITHDESGTPDRLAIKKFLATQLDEKIDNLYMVKIEGKTGTDKSLCNVEIYENKDLAEKTLPKHIITRNLPPEERKAKKEPEVKPQEAKKEKETEKAPPK